MFLILLHREIYVSGTSCITCWHLYKLIKVGVKCGKIMEVALGTLDIKSGPMRCWKGLWLQLMCCAPFRLLSQDFRMEYQRSEYWSMDRSCSRSRTWRMSYQDENLFNIWTEVSTWHVQGIYAKYRNKQRDKSENNKQTNSIRNTRYLWRTRSSLYLEL